MRRDGRCRPSGAPWPWGFVRYYTRVSWLVGLERRNPRAGIAPGGARRMERRAFAGSFGTNSGVRCSLSQR